TKLSHAGPLDMERDKVLDNARRAPALGCSAEVRRFGLGASKTHRFVFLMDWRSNSRPSVRKSPNKCQRAGAHARRTTGESRHGPRKGLRKGRNGQWSRHVPTVIVNTESARCL